MRLSNALLMSALFTVACGPESEPVLAEMGEQTQALASPPVITFWEDNHCGGDQVGWYIYNTGGTVMPNSGGSGWVNDEARSMMLFRVPAGTVFRVYNSPSGSLGDDWTEIVVHQYAEQLCIGSFQSTVPTAYYSLRYCDDGGLDGKVSLVRAQPTAFTDGYSCGGTWRYY
jgi:hypothetical protein